MGCYILVAGMFALSLPHDKLALYTVRRGKWR